jgi:hypothetical protein
MFPVIAGGAMMPHQAGKFLSCRGKSVIDTGQEFL